MIILNRQIIMEMLKDRLSKCSNLNENITHILSILMSELNQTNSELNNFLIKIVESDNLDDDSIFDELAKVNAWLHTNNDEANMIIYLFNKIKSNQNWDPTNFFEDFEKDNPE